MLEGNFTLRHTPGDEPTDEWDYLHGEEAKFGLLIVTSNNITDEYNFNLELNLRHGSCVGWVGKVEVKLKNDFRFIWVPMKLTIGSKDIANINDEFPEHKGVIKVIVSKKVDRHKMGESSTKVKESFKSLIGKITNKDKPSGKHIIIYQNINISHTLLFTTKVIQNVHLLIMENASSKTCVLNKVKSGFETLFSQHLQLLPTERFSLVLEADKVKSDILWINWSLETPEIQCSRPHLWSSVQLTFKTPEKLNIICSYINFIGGIATLSITIDNNATDHMELKLFPTSNENLVALQESYVIGLVKGKSSGSCEIEYIIVKRGLQRLPDMKLVDNLTNKSYLLSGTVFQF